MNDADVVEVTGTGSVTVVPDVLHAHLGVETAAPTVAEALERADTAIQAMVDALRVRGVAESDVQTTVMAIRSEPDRATGNPGAMRASLAVRVRLENIDAAGTLVSAAVEAGGEAGRVHGVFLDVSDPGAALAEAREAAWADALSRARQYAALAGRDLGSVAQVIERDGDGGAIPLARRASGEALGAQPRIEPGSDRLTATVAVRWRLL